jgi:long-chain fatty acid transport protein
MSKKFNWLTATTAVVALSMAGSAFATNGYFTHGTGTKNKAMAGSGIAMPEDSIDVANNPAVAPFVGEQLIIGAALFSPIRKYETSDSMFNGNFPAFTIGPQKLESDSNYFVIPHIAMSWQLDNGNALAAAFYGRGGMNTDWKGGTATFDPDGPMGPAPVSTFPGTYGAALFGGSGNAGVNLSQAFLDLTWGKKLSEHFSFGLTLVLAAQMFEADGVMTFAQYTQTFAESPNPMMPDMPTNLSNNGADWSYGYGFKIGIHAPLTERFAFGAMYQTETKMTDLDDYSDLFAEQGGFDVPADFKMGLTAKVSDTVSMNFDYQYIWYSDVASVGNPIQNLFSCPTAGMGGTDTSYCLGGNKGAGFGWDNMSIYKVGLVWTAGQDWTWRFGYSYGEQPIPSSEMTFNILAPATIEQHITAGFTLERTPGRQFNMAFMYAPNTKIDGPQNFDGPPDLAQTVTLEMYQWEVEASYSWRF